MIVFLIVPISHHRAAAYRRKIFCQDVRLSSSCGGVATAVMSNQQEEATANISAESVPQSQIRVFKGVVERVHRRLKL